MNALMTNSLCCLSNLLTIPIYTIWLKLDVKSTHERNIWLELHFKPTHESSMSSHPSSFGDSQEISVMYCNVNHSGRTKFWYPTSNLFSNLGTKTFQLVCLSWCNPQGAVTSNYLVCHSSNFNDCPRNIVPGILVSNNEWFSKCPRLPWHLW